MSYTPTNLVQYNEYYPFGLQTATSWARPTATGNNFLANGGTELNTTSSLYDLEYRNYDPVLGRMNGVDPMATKYASLSPYNFSFNDPVSFTDVTGADPLSDFLASARAMEKWFDETMPSAMDYNGNGGWGGGAGYNSMMGGYGTSGYAGEYSLGGLIGSYNSNYGGPVYVNSGGNTGHFASPTQLAWAQRQESEPLNATIEYERNKYECVRLEVSNGIVAGYEVFWTPAMQNLVASLNSFALAQDDQDRPDLGRIGNAYRLGLGTDFQKTLFEQYWLGSGKDYKLSKSEFDNIVATAYREGKFRTISETTLNGQKVIGVTVGFYGSQEYARALGTATFYMDYKGNPVGFRDDYDFNPLPWGDRSYQNEILTRMIDSDGRAWGAKPFKITYP